MTVFKPVAEGLSRMVEKARLLCKEKHLGQVDKEGKPYYLHPFAVARAVEGEEAKAVAYLHDVVEDTDTTLDDLRLYGFTPEVVEAVGAITREEGEDYFDYIERVRGNELARVVKLADLAHNTDPSRRGATEQMRARYERAKAMLKAG